VSSGTTGEAQVGFEPTLPALQAGAYPGFATEPRKAEESDLHRCHPYSLSGGAATPMADLPSRITVSHRAEQVYKARWILDHTACSERDSDPSMAGLEGLPPRPSGQSGRRPGG
jgi:hypothetical protein